MSPTVFNAVLEQVVRRLNAVWMSKRFGIKVDVVFLMNRRFADDISLLGATRARARSMLKDFSREAAEAGLDLHGGKRKSVHMLCTDVVC